MTTVGSTLNIQSNQITLRENIVSIVLSELNRGNVINAVDLFGENFKFIDHALGLEFNDRKRLEVFFRKTRELFPDAHVNVTTIIESGNRVVAEWTFTATHVELVWPGSQAKVPRALPGVSIVTLTDGRVSEWSDYYDKITARRSRLVDFFTEWTEL